MLVKVTERKWYFVPVRCVWLGWQSGKEGREEERNGKERNGRERKGAGGLEKERSGLRRKGIEEYPSHEVQR